VKNLLSVFALSRNSAGFRLLFALIISVLIWVGFFLVTGFEFT